MIEAEGIHQDISHHISIVAIRLFACSHTITACAGRKEIVAEGINNQAVHLLRHIHIKRTRACHKMCQFDASFLGNDSSRHRRGKVVDHNHHISRILLQISIKMSHHPTGYLIQAGTVNTKEHRRARHLQIIEERGLQSRIVLTTSIYQFILGTLSLLNGTNQRCHLHKIRACARNNTNIFHSGSKLFSFHYSLFL